MTKVEIFSFSSPVWYFYQIFKPFHFFFLQFLRITLPITQSPPRTLKLERRSTGITDLQNMNEGGTRREELEVKTNQRDVKHLEENKKLQHRKRIALFTTITDVQTVFQSTGEPGNGAGSNTVPPQDVDDSLPLLRLFPPSRRCQCLFITPATHTAMLLTVQPTSPSAVRSGTHTFFYHDRTPEKKTGLATPN